MRFGVETNWEHSKYLVKRLFIFIIRLTLCILFETLKKGVRRGGVWLSTSQFSDHLASYSI